MRSTLRYVAWFLLFLLLFNYPIIAVFDRLAISMGIPVLFIYILVCWCILIGGMFWMSEWQERSK